MIKRNILILFYVSFMRVMLSAQNNYELHQYEDTLKVLGKKILSGETDEEKYNANERFLELFRKALENESSYSYPFDSLITVSRLTSADKKFKIYTWTMFTSNGRYKCYGFILSRDSRKKINRLISLTDKSDSISKPEDMILGNDKWYGALYYKIIPTGNKSSKYYTLLGWHGNNKLTRRKVIESLTFDKEGNAVFGAPIFMTENAEPKRIVFEYSANASMSLKYEPQYYNKIRGQSIYAYDRLKNKKSRGKLKINPKKKRALMIVFDRLMPLSAGLAGQHQFYVATTDYVDGYIFRRGKWRLIYDIDARNSKSR